MDELSSCKENLCTLKSELRVVTDIKMENCLQGSCMHVKKETAKLTRFGIYLANKP